MNQNDEWYTPKHVLERVRTVMGGIDLDPASCDIAQNWVKAEKYYTKEDDALKRHWYGHVFMNPPYSNALIKRFIKHLVDEYEAGNIKEFICLTNSGTDTKWNSMLQKYLQVYTNGRIRFIQPNGMEKASGSRGQVFTYAGPNPEKFIQQFTEDGFCWTPNLEFIKANKRRLL